jgi:hypothetical protein
VSVPVPPIDQALLPTDIRDASPARRKAYEAGLSFERVLVGQLTEQLQKTAEDGGDQGGGAYAQLLPDALADGVMAGGGLGLARVLADATAPEKRP